MNADRGARAGYAAIGALGLIWGYNWVMIKTATYGATPFALAALRCSIAAAALFAVLAALRRPLRTPPAGPTIVLGLLNTTAFYALQTFAVAGGGAGKSAVLTYTAPFFIALLAWPILHERLTRVTLAALALAAGGLALVLLPFDATNQLLGKAFGVLTAFSWAVATVYVKHMRARHDVELLSLTAWQTLYGALGLVVIALLIPNQHVTWTPAFIGSLAYIAIPGTAIAMSLWLFSLSRLPANVAGIASLLIPVAGVGFAWLQLGERPSGAELAGIGLILAALVTNTAFSSSARPDAFPRTGEA